MCNWEVEFDMTTPHASRTREDLDIPVAPVWPRIAKAESMFYKWISCSVRYVSRKGFLVMAMSACRSPSWLAACEIN